MSKLWATVIKHPPIDGETCCEVDIALWFSEAAAGYVAKANDGEVVELQPLKITQADDYINGDLGGEGSWTLRVGPEPKSIR